MGPLEVCVLGSLQIKVAGRPVPSLESEKARALLVYLTIESNRPHRREKLMTLLWPESPDDLARGNLRQTLYILRHALGDPDADPPYLLNGRDELQFNCFAEFALDAITFLERLAAVESHRHPAEELCPACLGALNEAVALYRGKFLEHFYLKDSAEFEEWALVHREALHRRALEALDRLTRFHLRQGSYEPALNYAQRQLELDPWREEAHRALMLALAGAGQRSAALVQYETCRRVLQDELGAEPSAETKELHARINRGEPAARRVEGPASFTPVRPLPIPLTPFVGREPELAELGRLLGNPECRLITLVGPGGIGKTRLALEVAALHRADFGDGAAFIPLDPVRSAAAVPPAIAAALGFEFSGPADPLTQLTSLLRGRQMLLVADNLEHLLDCAPMWLEILQHAPGLKLLVTSREPLNLQGEWVFGLEGLPVPAEGRIDELETNPAAALFLQRARRAHVAFEMDASDRAAVATLCGQVGGMPLALELAATWVRTLSCCEIVDEIERSADFLAAPLRDLDERHRSVRAVFDRSWEMLAPDERRALARASAFHGGFAREAAEQVAGASLRTLSALVAKSLLRRVAGGPYSLHELVRQYAAAQLAAYEGEPLETQGRHSAYYLDWLGSRDTALRSGRQKAVLAELTAEMDNLRAAWEWAVINGDVARVHRVSSTLWYLYQHHNWFAEGEAVFRRAAGALEEQPAGASESTARRTTVCALLAHSAFFAFSRGRVEEAYGDLAPIVAALPDTTDARALAYCHWYMGIVAWGSGRYGEAIDGFEESLKWGREADEPYYEAAAGTFLGVVQHELGDYGEAEEWFAQALHVARRLGDIMLLSHLLGYASLTALARGENTEAEKMLHESLSLAREIGCRTSEALAMDGLGQVCAATGNRAEADSFFAAATDIYRDIRSSWNLSRVQHRRGQNLLALGRLADARAALIESLNIAWESGLVSSQLETLAVLAAVETQQPEATDPDAGGGRALELAIAILNHPSASPEVKQAAEFLRCGIEHRSSYHAIDSDRAVTF